MSDTGPRASSRRHFLRGAGVALALPWLESMAPRQARGQAVLARRRFVAMSFPCGTASFWAPTGTGAGAAWKLSPILEPLAPVKSQVSVLTHVGNYSPWGGHIEPSHGHLAGAFLTCTRASGMFNNNGGTSVDQVIAQALGKLTPLDSLQVGLSTLDSSPDGLPGQHSRSISWASPTMPLGKLVDPKQVFSKLFGAMPQPAQRPAGEKSVIDQVLAQAMSLQPKVSRSDRLRVDEFLSSVREVEKKIGGMALPPACTTATEPAQSYAVGNVPSDYSRDKHADIMIDLVALAFQCDLTRVVSFMLDDSRSDFNYGFVPPREFTATGSLPGGAIPGGLHGQSSSGDTNSAWATIVHWFVQKLSRLSQKLAALPEGISGSVLDQSVVWFGSEMHGGNHDGLDLPLLYVGSGGGRLEVDRRLDFAARPRQSEDLANVYLTFLRKVFDLPVTSFGMGVGEYVNAGRQLVPEILTG
jgi:hypothetical protein